MLQLPLLYNSDDNKMIVNKGSCMVLYREIMLHDSCQLSTVYMPRVNYRKFILYFLKLRMIKLIKFDI